MLFLINENIIFYVKQNTQQLDISIEGKLDANTISKLIIILMVADF